MEFSAIDFHLWREILIALFIGALIGTERTLTSDTQKRIFTGLRTFSLVSLMGFLLAYLAERLNFLPLFAIGLVAVIALFIVVYLRKNTDERAEHGFTTEIAGILTYLLGGLVVLVDPYLAIVLTIIISLILALKLKIQSVLNRFTHEEILATLRLLFASFILLPLLPNRAIDPWNVLNPNNLWLLVLLISSFSFLGFIAGKFIPQDKSIVLTALMGSLVSSTAMTVSISQQMSRQLDHYRIFVAAVLAGWAVMFLRIVFLSSVLVPHFVWPLAKVLILPVLVCFIFSVVFYWRAAVESPWDYKANVKNPFSLKPALIFAAFFALILLVSEAVRQFLSDQAYVLFVAVTALTDVDAISMVIFQNLASQGIQIEFALKMILLIAGTNTLAKGGVLLYYGPRQKRLKLVALVGLIVLAHVLVWLLL